MTDRPGRPVGSLIANEAWGGSRVSSADTIVEGEDVGVDGSIMPEPKVSYEELHQFAAQVTEFLAA